MIVLFTDFGLNGPYVGQVKAALLKIAPNVAIVDLFADAPRYNPRSAAYLLAAYTLGFDEGTVFLCVVDPGVGSALREPVVVWADGYWFVGTDNGLLHGVAGRAHVARRWVIDWRPAQLSASFHGRDLFAPVAARLALGEAPPGQELGVERYTQPPWPADLREIIYIDHFGNALTGIRAQTLGAESILIVNKQPFVHLRTFADAPTGSGFWYENANGLAEIAVNQGRADSQFGLKIGSVVSVKE